MSTCPVCECEERKTESRDDVLYHECLRCGPYSISGSAQATLKSTLQNVKNGPAILSYALCRMTRREQWALLNTESLRNILQNTTLPSHSEQLQNLILWLAESQKDYGSELEDLPIAAVSACGALDQAGLTFVVKHAIASGLVQATLIEYAEGTTEFNSVSLTFEGWNRVDELQRGSIQSRLAFMAMKFGDPETDRIYAEYFKVAVKEAGFELRRNDESQRAGLIDDLMRVQIRQSCFVIADLTGHSNGAYWEAGYAEGLGKPVIYTCKKDVFEDPTGGAHFDTNHHLTVVWNPQDMSAAVKQLKATIRATLPEEATFERPPPS